MMAVAEHQVLPFRWRMPTKRNDPPSSEELQLVGSAIRSLRKQMRKTQDEAAKLAGVTRNTWQNYENGDRQAVLRSDLQRKLALALGADEIDLKLHIAAAQTLAGYSAPPIPDAPRQAESSAQPRGRAVFPLAEGDVTLSFPPDLSTEGFQQLADYLSLFLKQRGATLP